MFTFPRGLFGVLTIIALVLLEKADDNSAGSNFQSFDDMSPEVFVWNYHKFYYSKLYKFQQSDNNMQYCSACKLFLVFTMINSNNKLINCF